MRETIPAHPMTESLADTVRALCESRPEFMTESGTLNVTVAAAAIGIAQPTLHRIIHDEVGYIRPHVESRIAAFFGLPRLAPEVTYPAYTVAAVEDSGGIPMSPTFHWAPPPKVSAGGQKDAQYFYLADYTYREMEPLCGPGDVLFVRAWCEDDWKDDAALTVWLIDASGSPPCRLLLGYINQYVHGDSEVVNKDGARRYVVSDSDVPLGVVTLVLRGGENLRR